MVTLINIPEIPALEMMKNPKKKYDDFPAARRISIIPREYFLPIRTHKQGADSRPGNPSGSCGFTNAGVVRAEAAVTLLYIASTIPAGE